jgi:phosphatidate cytidylyltransferase
MMLKQRLITAAVLIPLVVWALLALSTEAVRYGLVLIAILAAWEWLALIGLAKKHTKLILTLAMLLLGIASSYYLSTATVLTMTSFIWLSASLLILLYAHKPMPARVFKLFQQTVFGVITAALILIGFVMSAVWIHSLPTQGPALLLFVLVSVWLADTGGYFAGKRFGKYKLAEAISPNKTWEGVVGALVLSSLWATLFYNMLESPVLPLIGWIALTGLVVMISIVGDLFESVFKRCFNTKDSGTLLPGHGGMLDRIDSLLAAVPAFAAVLMVIGA